MMIFKGNHGEFVNWVVIMHSQLVKELIIWEKCSNNMIEGIAKIEPKKNVYHSTIVLKVIFQKWFSLGEES